MTNFTWDQNILIFTFDEHMDSKSSMEAEALIEQAIKDKQPQEIIFDLKNTNYVASAFLRICIIVVKKMGKENFSIINTQQSIKKIFKISGIEEFLNIS